MEKQTKITYLFFGLAILSSVLHNAVFAIFKFEEPVFFFLSLISILCFILSIIYNTFTYIRKGKPEDLWKLGWLGLFGLIGLLPNFGLGFYGLFGFYGFFGAKGGKSRK